MIISIIQRWREECLGLKAVDSRKPTAEEKKKIKQTKEKDDHASQNNR